MESAGDQAGTGPVKAGRIGATVIRPGWVLLSILVVLISGIIAILQAPDPQPNKTEKSFLEWLRYPVETNPGLRLQSAPAQINSVAFADNGKDGLAVGEGGTILASADGGETWAAQNSGISNSLNDVYCSATCKQAWVVGESGAILTTTDGGNRWTARQIEGGSGLSAVVFRKGDTAGWIVGSSGNIWSSRDGGRSWQKKRSPDSSDLKDLCFDAQGQRGWTVGAGGILRTLNGGESWSLQNSGLRGNLVSVSCGTDGEEGWVVGFGAFLSTTDGGEHWKAVNLDQKLEAAFYYSRIRLNSNGSRGWVTRDDGGILTTADRGKTWTKQTSGTNTLLRGVHVHGQGRLGWAAGSSGTIISTTNGGADWVTRTTSKFSHLRAIHLDPSGRAATAVGDAGIIVTTRDGGVRWTSQHSGVDQRLNGVYFLADNLRGWAVGNAGKIIVTQDGGEHWTAQENPVALNLYAVRFESSGQRGWAVGNSGLVLTTENGGRQWNARYLPNQSNLTNLYFEPTGKQGWAVGYNGFIWASTDGGRTWLQSNSGTVQGLWGIWFDADGRRGWVVGDTGTIIFTGDGGRTWSPQQGGTNADFSAVQFLPGGLRGWVIGANGIILSTNDGGKSWSAADSKVGSTRDALAFAADGSTGWVVGYPPALVKTSDGGKTWEPIPWPVSNERYPAPWFWISLSVAAFCFWRSVRTDPASATSAIEAMGTSDAPVGEFALDRLQFGPLARGISRFLRNTNTRPPLTLTISGDWGSGKSTLMELVCADLRGYGIRPVWFNAWHHQQEEQLLAALLNAIRATGLPSIGSADGLAFRFRLLLSRSKKHFAVSVLLIAAVATLTGYLLGHHFSEWIVLWNTVSGIGASMSSNKEAISKLTIADASWLSAQLAGAAATLYSLYRGFAAFPVDPAVLLANTADGFKLKHASAKTSFRDRFATEFGEVTDALPYTMVIVIDDLDRCQPSTVLTIMEAVNFLVSSGTCFVMFGMATNRVEAALAIEFEKIADELAAAGKRSITDEKQTPDARRLNYVRDYLDKLVNLEIVVPDRADILPQLLEDASTANSTIILKAVKQALEFWPSWLAAVIVVLGLLLGFEYRFPHATIQKAPPPVAQFLPDQAAAPTVSPVGSALLTATTDTPNRYVPTMQTNSEFVLDKLAIAITIAIIVAFAGGMALYGLRANLRSVHDSQEFRSALRVWISVVQRRRVTPRGIKRFGNRLRYLAMLQQPGRLDETGFDKLRRRLKAAGKFFSKRDALDTGTRLFQADISEEHGISESVLVALAALHEVYGPEWRSQMRPSAAGNLEGSIQTAIASHELMTKQSWPPGDDDVAAFERLLSGIRNA